MKLVELHVFERKTLAVNDSNTVTCESVRVRSGLEDLAETTGCKHDAFALKNVKLSGGKFVSNNSRWALFFSDLGHHQVEHVELVVELDAELDAVLIQGLQNHVAGAVCCVARAANRSLAVVASVTTETTLVDLAVWCAVER